MTPHTVLIGQMKRTHECFPLKAPVQDQIAFLAKVLDIPGAASEFGLKQLTGGCTNSMFRFNSPIGKYAIRVFGKGTDEVLDRRVEIEAIQMVGLIRIYAIFGNGIILTWQRGKTLDYRQMSDPSKAEQNARMMARMHKATLALWNQGEKRSNRIFDRMNIWLEGIDYSDPGRGINHNWLENKLSELRQALELEMEEEPIVLCHGDWASTNLLWDEREKAIRVLDYEYCVWTWPQFDIANHFFEWGGWVMNASNFPSFEEQVRFLRIYLEELLGSVPTEELVLEWQRKCEKLVKLSNLFWAMWALYAEKESDVEWPYNIYWHMRLKLMEKTMPLEDGDELKTGPLLPLPDH
jgi:ethanolamine kinase